MTAPKGPPWWRPFAKRQWRRAMALPTDLPRRLSSAVAALRAELGLEVIGDCSATDMVFRGRLLPRVHIWIEVKADEQTILTAAAGMLRAIEAEHGSGRVWTLPLLEVVHLVYDDGALVRLDARRRPRVRLRAAYHHEANSLPIARTS